MNIEFDYSDTTGELVLHVEGEYIPVEAAAMYSPPAPEDFEVTTIFLGDIEITKELNKKENCCVWDDIREWGIKEANKLKEESCQ